MLAVLPRTKPPSQTNPCERLQNYWNAPKSIEFLPFLPTSNLKVATIQILVDFLLQHYTLNKKEYYSTLQNVGHLYSWEQCGQLLAFRSICHNRHKRNGQMVPSQENLQKCFCDSAFWRLQGVVLTVNEEVRWGHSSFPWQCQAVCI